MQDSTIKTIQKLKKTAPKTIQYPIQLYDQSYHVSYINKIFMDVSFEHDNLILKEIKKKISSYRQQDICKNKFDADMFVSLEDVILKLVECKLICCYCRCKLQLLYQNTREESQWTLDRIDNDLGHIANNVVISCLACNLKRRTTNMEKFKFTKQLKLVKL